MSMQVCAGAMLQCSFGAAPSALGGAIIGSSTNMLKQVVKKALGVPGMIDKTVDTIRDRINEVSHSPCE